MTLLGFRAPFDDEGLDFPVEVRATNMRLVGRTTMRQYLQVDAGTYVVTSVLPSGEELFGTVEVGKEGTVIVDLSHDEDDGRLPLDAADPSENQAWFDDTLTFYAPAPQPPSVVVLTQIRGNLLTGATQETRIGVFDANDAAPIGLNESSFVRVSQEGFPPMICAAPSVGWQSSNLLLKRTNEGGWHVDLELANSSANLLLRYREHGRAQEAAGTLASPALNAEELLRGKMEDPIAAAVGAYALLRFAELDRLHDWTENLFNWFEWLPDAAAIRAEQLARLGNHQDAYVRFVELLRRGLPFFTDGFSFALDRLRLYADIGVITPQGQRLLDRLKQIAPAVDFGSPTLRLQSDLLPGPGAARTRPASADSPNPSDEQPQPAPELTVGANATC